MFGDCISEDIKNLKDIKDLCNYKITKRALALKLLEKLECNDIFFNHIKVHDNGLDKENHFIVYIELEINNKTEKVNSKIKTTIKIEINLINNVTNTEIKISTNETLCKNKSFNCQLNDFYNDVIEKTKKELIGASTHLAYEFDMLNKVYLFFNHLNEIIVIDNNIFNSLLVIINNMRIESLRIHIRSLLEFFKLRENNRFDDIVYKDFFCNPINKNQASFTPKFEETNIYDIIKNKINLTTAHLSYIRVDQSKDDREPNLEEIKKVINEINNNMYDFYNAVDKDLLSDYSKEVFKNHFKNNNENNK